MSMITLDNYEEYIIMHIDGELQPHEEQALQAFLAQHPQLQSEMDAYSSTQLIPDHSQVYAQKDTLLKPLAEKKVIPMPRWRTYGMAAGVAAMLICTVFVLRNNTNNGTQVAQVATQGTPSTTNNTTTPQPAPANNAVAAAPTTNNNNDNNNNIPTGTKTTTPAIPVKTTHTANTNNTGIAAVKNEKNNTTALAANNRKPLILQAVTAGELKAFPVEATTPQPIAVANVAPYVLPDVAPEEKQSWFDRLPIDENKKKNLANAAMAVANKYDQISEFRDNLSKKHVSLKVEHKKLIVSF